jgi:hypothetical protein
MNMRGGFAYAGFEDFLRVWALKVFGERLFQLQLSAT